MRGSRMLAHFSRGSPRRILFLVTLIASQSVGGTSSTPLADLDQRFARTGEFERCLTRFRIDRIRVLDDQHVLFRAGLKRHYLNTLARPCVALSRNDALMIDTRTPRLCDVDVVRVINRLNPQFRGPACLLGRFERLEPREKKIGDRNNW